MNNFLKSNISRISLIVVVTLIIGIFSVYYYTQYYYLPQVKKSIKKSWVKTNKLDEVMSEEWKKMISSGEYPGELNPYRPLSDREKKLKGAMKNEEYDEASRILKDLIEKGNASPGVYLWMYRAKMFQAKDFEKGRKEAIGYIKEGLKKYPDAIALKEVLTRYKKFQGKLEAMNST